MKIEVAAGPARRRPGRRPLRRQRPGDAELGPDDHDLAKALFDPVKLKGFKLLPDAVGQGQVPPLAQVLARPDQDARAASDLYVVDNKFAPGGTTGWHSHPGPSLIFVVAGTVTNYLGDDPSCTGHPYSAGSGFIDRGRDDMHMLRNEGTVPAETIAVQFLPPGADRRIDEPDPGNCKS